ncbi:acyl-CoA synthetase [Mycolicibacterium parafortuitum]|uniref:Acyl-CoA synthetase n=1 Tax=Mycolicibacterium parafortuitum TaxID=39692 RepID=A0A7I7UB99_MYCPF|nr:fatty-acid--CoA ligase FadD4 [Mycolicibacterium parafortuitum]BBY78400.1 acyl-CoA synthetase [Mycolicibacterium parafortuitum]
MEIRQWADAERPALIMYPSGTRITFAELESAANRLAHHFRAAGLREGDVVAVLMDNSEHTHAVLWAARRAGLYYATINTHLTPAEAAHIVDDCGAKAIVASRTLRDVCVALEPHLRRGLPALRLIADTDADGWQRYPDCVAGRPDTPLPDEREGDLLQYSSGTTGKPKGIRRPLPACSPREAAVMLAPLLGAIGVDDRAVYLSPAPLYHTAPSFWSMSAQALGATVVMLDKFDPVVALEAIQNHRVTHGQFVPTMFVRMLKMPAAVRESYDVSSLRRVVHAAAPCPPEIKRRMIDWWGPIVDEFYGSSEGVGVTFIRADEWLAHPGSVGRPLAGIAHVVGDDGRELPPGTPGDIYFEGAGSFSYLNDPVKTAAAHNDRGWVGVGDVGYLDDDGYLYLTDRRHHVIISGGVNIYPQEAEDLLISHPRVLDAAVFGIPDATMGQAVKAVVQALDPAEATDAFADELMDWLRGRLAHYKCPRSLAFAAELPRTAVGKLDKRNLIAHHSL